jgi:hypothetical protein
MVERSYEKNGNQIFENKMRMSLSIAGMGWEYRIRGENL